MMMRWAWTCPMLSILALTWTLAAQAQGPGPGYYGPGPGAPPGAMGPGPQGMYGPPGMMPAAYQPPPMADAYGAYGSAPAGPAMMPAVDTAMPAGCPYCGGSGCEACGGGYGDCGPHGLGNGLLGDVFGLIGPYSDGGCAAVRWYDFSLDYMHLQREDVCRNMQFTSDGIGGPIVLETNNLDFDAESGFRFSAMMQVAAASDLEFTFYGLFFSDDSASVSSANNDLYSVVSQFGTVPFGGFAETDESDFQSIQYESQFDNFEVNFRRRWQAPSCRYQGSYLYGIRYFKLKEDFNYFTQSTLNGAPGTPNTALFNTHVNDNLVGFQLGGDLWICLVPGLRVGGEFKAGVYGNRYNVDNTVTAPQTAPGEAFVEEIVDSDVAFIGQADLSVTYRLNYQWTLKGGYQFLYVDGVALAPEQFNATPPVALFPLAPGTRTAFTNDNGDLFYHGWSIGAEFMW